MNSRVSCGALTLPSFGPVFDAFRKCHSSQPLAGLQGATDVSDFITIGRNAARLSLCDSKKQQS